MLIGVTVMTDAFWDVTTWSGRLTILRILKRKEWRQQVSSKIGNGVLYYIVVHPRWDSRCEESYFIY
jgi:hypothetical protein